MSESEKSDIAVIVKDIKPVVSNKASEVLKCPFLTVDEHLPKLNNAKMFSCVNIYRSVTWVLQFSPGKLP